MASFTYDGEALLDEQADLLSSSTPFDINYVAFLRTKLAAQQRATMQRNQQERRDSNFTPVREAAAVQNMNHVRANLDLQSPDPRPRRESYASESAMNEGGSGEYHPFASGMAAFSEDRAQRGAARRGSLAASGPRRPMDLGSSERALSQLPPATPMTFDDVPASATARLELASVTNMGESANGVESFIRESRARSIGAEGGSATRNSVSGSRGRDRDEVVMNSLDERIAVAKGEPEVPEDAVPFASGNVGGAGEAALVPCPHCGRTFVPDRVDRHAKLCATQRARDAKKPKVDMIKSKRIQHLYESEAVEPPPSATAQSQNLDSLNTTWRRQSAQLRTALNGSTNGAGDMYPVEDDRVRCAGCGRRFAKDVAERHVPACIAKNAPS